MEKNTWKEKITDKTLQTHDQVNIFYQTIESPAKKVVALANGLGGRLYVWEPLINALFPEYKIICWDYRGLFQSGAPESIRRLAIPEHAEDLKQILDKENIASATVIGWSMGVQVALEFATLYPEKTDALVLLNGTYGQALSTGFQPIFRFPNLNRLMHEVIDFVRDHRSITNTLSKIMVSKSLIRPFGKLYGMIRGNPQIEDAIVQYVEDVFGTDFNNYLRLFQELDAHSVYHHLRYIQEPVMVIWGCLDYLTPAYQSKEMVKKLPNVHYKRYRLGTHFVLIEYPKQVAADILEFLHNQV